MIAARLSKGEDLIGSIRNIAERERVCSGVFSAIGTVSQAHFYFYAPKRTPILLKEPLEIVSCIGSISLEEGEAFRTWSHLDLGLGVQLLWRPPSRGDVG
jgi:predicted DNA-binding protein with PD1-like motif